MVGGGKTKTTQENKVPEWVSQGGQSLYNQASDYVANNPVQSYTGQFAASPSENQQQANTVAASSVGSGQGDVQTARDLTKQAASGTWQNVTGGNQQVAQMAQPDQWTSAGVASSYMSPYTKQVQDATLAEMDRGAQINQRSVNDQAQASKAFGGDRHAIMASEQAKNDATARTNYVAQSNDAAYQNAQSQFNQDRAAGIGVSQANMSAQNSAYAGDADRAYNAQVTNSQGQQGVLDRILSAAGLSSDLGAQASGLSTADVQRLLTTGVVDQQTRQLENDAQYNDWLRTQEQPLNQYSQLAGILSGVPINTTTSSTSKQSGGLVNTLLGAGQIAGSIWSDSRLKEDIVAVGHIGSVPVYAYRYRGQPEQHVGVMAQDVARRDLGAVSVAGNGYMKVDYSRLERLAA